MNLDEIRKALRKLPPDQLRAILEEFSQPVTSATKTLTKEEILKIAEDVVEKHKDVLQRLADR